MLFFLSSSVLCKPCIFTCLNYAPSKLKFQTTTLFLTYKIYLLTLYAFYTFKPKPPIQDKSLSQSPTTTIFHVQNLQLIHNSFCLFNASNYWTGISPFTTLTLMKYVSYKFIPIYQNPQNNLIIYKSCIFYFLPKKILATLFKLSKVV